MLTIADCATHVIEFNGLISSHETWFIIVVLSICMSYDLQSLDSFNINVIGAQSSVRERFITAAPTEYGADINTPSVYKRPKKIYTAPAGNKISAKGNINSPGDHIIYGDDADIDHDDFEDFEDFEDSDYEDQDESFSYLIFKKFSFKLDDKKQRLLLLNTLLLIYCVGNFIYFFNFWVNFDEASFKKMQTYRPSDFALHLKKGTYEWYCMSFGFMIIISVAVIFMEWFFIPKKGNENGNGNRYKVYRYSCGVLYVACGLLQCISVIFGTNDYCKHLDRSLENNGKNYYCHMQYVGTQLISIMLPLCILSIDVVGFTKLLFGHTRIRVEALHFMISLSSLLFYIGYYNYYTDLNTYTKAKLSGLLMIIFSFIFSTIMSPLFLYLESTTFSNLSNVISSVLIIVGAAVVLDVHNLYINIAEWTLFLPICCLVAYEIQLL